MQSASSFALLAEIAAFLFIAFRSACEFFSTSPQCINLWLRLRRQVTRGGYAPADDSTTSSLAGAGARRSVQALLAVSCAARAMTTVLVIYNELWMPYLCVPDMAYLSTYTKLVLFLSQLQYTAVGYRNVWLPPVLWLSLVLVVTVSLVVCMVWLGGTPRTTRSLRLRKFLFYELGVTYLLLFVAFTYFGIRVCDVSQRRRTVYYRVIVMTSVCGIALFARGVFLIASAADVFEMWFSASLDRYWIEGLVGLTEVIPSAVIIALTTKSRRQRFPPPTAQDAVGFTRLVNSSSFSASTGASPGAPSNGPFNNQYGSTTVHPA